LGARGLYLLEGNLNLAAHAIRREEAEGKMAQVKGKVQNTAGGMKDKMKEKNQEGGT
jgi:hypothetical protein